MTPVQSVAPTPGVVGPGEEVFVSIFKQRVFFTLPLVGWVAR